eukprot:5315279-Pleurochrysis_carterae.AAC.1
MPSDERQPQEPHAHVLDPDTRCCCREASTDAAPSLRLLCAGGDQGAGGGRGGGARGEARG